MSDTLVVSELFGPTVQGEGPSTGRRCAFLRLGRCNLDCSWCDTPYTWDWRGKNGTKYDPAVELSTMTVDEAVDAVRALDVSLVIVTGGEPMLQQRALARFVDRVPARVEVETNGTIMPTTSLSHHAFFVVSPKLNGSGVARERALDFAVLAQYRQLGAVFKFVCCDAIDVAEVDGIVDRLTIPHSQVWVMPEGRDVDKLAAAGPLAELAIARGYNVSGRLHVTLWGDRRGV